MVAHPNGWKYAPASQNSRLEKRILEDGNRMRNRLFSPRVLVPLLTLAATFCLAPTAALASKKDLVLPDLRNPSQHFFGMTGHTLLTLGLVVAALGIVFGLVIYKQLQALPVHRSMKEVSDLIYETCKTYLLNQGRFILILWIFIAAVMVFYFGFLSGHDVDPAKRAMIAARGLTEYSKGIEVPV